MFFRVSILPVEFLHRRQEFSATDYTDFTEERANLCNPCHPWPIVLFGSGSSGLGCRKEINLPLSGLEMALDWPYEKPQPIQAR